MTIQKQYARRSIGGYTSPYDDSFTYKPITSLPKEEVTSILSEVQYGSAGRDMTDEDAATKWGGMVEFANTAYDPSYWMIAYDKERPVGLVFAQRYFDKMHEGSLFMLGLTPEYRGKGFGKVIHARGLQLLAEMGCTEYVGSTDVENKAMVRVFEENGCRLTAVHTVELTPGVGKIIE